MADRNWAEAFDYWKSTFSDLTTAIDWDSISEREQKERMLQTIKKKLAEPDIADSRKNLLPDNESEHMPFMDRMFHQFTKG
jgi:hypothetical protein